MKNHLTKVLALIMLVAISGCVTPGMRMDRNNSNLLTLEMEMTKQQVLEIMGKPDLNEAYKSLYGKYMVIFFYYTQRQRSDGNTTKDECTPVIFENGKLIGWGSEFYEIRKNIDITIREE
jgi:outer membrane protein assembly factor BamE (lipoprotein component of BamABCDE complex)